MIGRVYRGGQVGGLLRYLYGPGRHNEHDNPHLVAAWDLTSPAELATLEPRVLAGESARAMRDFAPMTGSLELATAFRPLTDKAAAKVVWHCPLRTAPGDRRLSDEEWAEVARDVMHRTGIAPRGDDGGCRWIAVRHDEESVHLVAILARQDGQAVRIGNDYRHLREACRAAEQRLGLVGTAPADLTADRHTTRAEVEKAARAGRMPDRDWLREQVQVAALSSSSSADFLAALRAQGVLVRERRDRDGALTGYAVGRPTPVGERQVLFGGGKLAPDLSLPRLQGRWQDAARPASGAPARRGAAGELAAALAARAEPARRLGAVVVACRQATSVLTESAAAPGGGQDDVAEDVVAASADVFRSVGLLVGGPHGVPLRAAARDVDRASRTSGGQVTVPSAAGQRLRRSARGVARATSELRSAMGLDPEMRRVLVELERLLASVRDLRHAQQRLAQASAAARAARAAQPVSRQLVMSGGMEASRRVRQAPSTTGTSRAQGRRR